ncbi:MAG: hypothetical protein LBE36_06270 [Flavobacteriaceae bacterium]|jgi:hypothetical protein|nr:hypothetical protein [Flavobacteriaceae bacterium]
MPIYGEVTGMVTPTVQNISWDRANLPPSIANLLIKLIGSNVQFIAWNIIFENTSVEWLHSGNSTSGYVNFSGTNGNLQLQFKNLEQLTGSNYKATVIFELSGYDPISDQSVSKILTSVINLSITGNDPNAVKTNKTNYNVLFVRNLNQLSGDTLVQILNNTANKVFEMETIGTYFAPQSSATQFNILNHPTSPLGSNPNLPQNGTVVVSCRLKNNGQYFYYFTITLTIINSDEILADPTSLAFQLRNGFNETQNAALQITNPLQKSFTIAAPNWLILSANSGNNSVSITVTTVNSDTMNTGFYTGNIDIKVNNIVVTSVPVTLSVTKFVDVALKDYNFCLDGVNFSISKMFENGVFAKVSLAMEITTEAETSTTNAVYSVPYFNEKAVIDIGPKVQNYFPIYAKHLLSNLLPNQGFNNKLVYKPIKVSATVEELDVNYEVLNSKTLPDILLFAGNKPKNFPLFTNFGIRRRYFGSVHIFSYFTGLANASQFTNANVQNNPAGNNEVQTALAFENILNFNAIKNNFGLEFLPFPKVKKQSVLQWINNNLVPEWMILSGSYKIQDDFEQIFDNFQKDGKKYDSKELAKITISTGFILKEESGLIKEIVKSPLSFLKIEDKIYKCFCTSTKLIEEDSELNLIQFELEFLIVL